MRKVLVIGSGGGGKSTLAVELGRLLGLPVVHLDALHWKPGWIVPDQQEWRETVRALAQRDEWVMDGNYTRTLDLRIPAADTVIFMDFPPITCVWRVLKRRVRYRGGTRLDMAPGLSRAAQLGLHEMGVDLQRPEAEDTEGGRGARAGRESPGAAKLQGGRRLPLEDASPESSPRRCGQGLGAHRVGADPRSLSQKSPLPGGERVRVRATA